MKKRLFTFLMLLAFVSVGMRAAIEVYPANTYVGSTATSGYSVLGATAGEIKQLLNGTYTGTVNWNGAQQTGLSEDNLNALKSAELIKIGSGSNATATPVVLNDDDLEALSLLSAKYLDLDGAVLADGADITNIKGNGNIVAVSLPNGLTKTQVNAVGEIMTASNANFGSCLSQDTEVTETEVTNYYYTEGSNSGQKVVEGDKVVLDKTNLTATVKEDVTVNLILKEGYPVYTYTNSYNNNEKVTVTNESDIEEYEEYGQTKKRIKPNPLTVSLTENTKYYKTDADGGAEMNTWDMANVDGTYYYGGSWNYNTSPATYENGTKAVVKTTYTYYTKDQWGNNQTLVTYDGTVTDNGDGTYTGEIENTSIYFEVSSEYVYTYTLDEDEKEYTTNAADDDLQWTTTHDVVYAVEAKEETETSSSGIVTAYVNTPGTLYQSTYLGVDANKVEQLVISGNINNGDISNAHGSTDPSASNNDADKYDDNKAISAFNTYDPIIKSIDISDCVIDDYKHLRTLMRYSTLETLVFPKNLERIPNYCCYANGNSGCKSLKNVTFPENLTEIGNYAFHDTKLEELVLPGTITSVGAYAFYSCKNLENVEMESLDGTCTFGEYVFASSGVKHVTLSEGVDAISERMFDVCASLESVRIPTTAKTIKTGAFAGCTSLHKLVIPEGVELLEKSIFDGAGLTDIYVMATSVDKVPKIYCLDQDGNGTGTFSTKNILGNNTAPTKTKGTDYDENTPEETALSWYQEEFSDMTIGLGGNNCMIQLHYPENMKEFYNGTANLPDGWKNNIASDKIDMDIFNWEIGLAEEQGWLSAVYAYGSQEYDAAHPGSTKGNSNVTLGPTAGGLYWPVQQDYYIRLAAGYTSTGEATAEAWRQIPLQGIATANDFTFTKKYDDTWYTMCFPWDMDDNTLFSTFNQKCEIVEFVGAEMLKSNESDYEYNLVFHFDEVAGTYYMNEDHSKKYDRVSSEHTRVVEMLVNGNTVQKKYYTYKNQETGDLVYWPYHTGNEASAEEKAMQSEYNDILHLMVFAGHPYMIHPSIGAKAGRPKDCTIAGIKKVKVGDGEDYATYAALAEAQAQSYVVTSNKAGESSPTAWANPVNGGGGSYTFIGNINDAVETEGVSDNGAQDMPTEKGPVYFLGVKPGTVYPQFFKKAKGKGQGKWTQYSAIIVPNQSAIDNVEGLNGLEVDASTDETAPSKGYDVVFGEWEIVEPEVVSTAIESAVAEEEETGKPAQIIRMNVVYNIKGQVVRTDSTSVEGLPKGLYIVNGKKYMVK